MHSFQQLLTLEHWNLSLHFRCLSASSPLVTTFSYFYLLSYEVVFLHALAITLTRCFAPFFFSYRVCTQISSPGFGLDTAQPIGVSSHWPLAKVPPPRYPPVSYKWPRSKQVSCSVQISCLLVSLLLYSSPSSRLPLFTDIISSTVILHLVGQGVFTLHKS